MKKIKCCGFFLFGLLGFFFQVQILQTAEHHRKWTACWLDLHPKSGTALSWWSLTVSISNSFSIISINLMLYNIKNRAFVIEIQYLSKFILLKRTKIHQFKLICTWTTQFNWICFEQGLDKIISRSSSQAKYFISSKSVHLPLVAWFSLTVYS